MQGASQRALLVLVIVLVGSMPTASAQRQPTGSIRFTGAVHGAAKRVRVQCFSSSTGESGLVARAKFSVDADPFRMTIYFGSPVEPGTRAFGATAGPSTVLVSLTGPDPATQWVSSSSGSGIVEDDRRSGSVDGELTATDGRVTHVSARFDCPETSRSRRDPDWSGPVQSTVNGSECTGDETGTITVIVVGRNASAGLEAAGSYTCSGVTVPTAGGIIYSGRLEHGSFLLRPEELFGVLLPTWNCSPRALKIPVRRGSGSIDPRVTAPSGDVYACNIEVREQGT